MSAFGRIPGFGEVAERLRRSTVQVLEDGRLSSGSGVLWNAEGLIVTNAHVIQGGRARIELWDGRGFEGTVISRDPWRDLAAVKIPAAELPAATRRDSDSVRPGELALAVGNPLGFIGALATGVVYACGPVRGLGSRTWVQAAIRLAPGNSGGPLADAQGRVIGLNTMVVSGGLGLAVPANVVASFVQGLRPRATLGAVIRPVANGLMILEVVPGGAADRASLLPGDIVTGSARRTFGSPEDLAAAVAEAKGRLQLHFLRGGQTTRRETTVQLEIAEANAA